MNDERLQRQDEHDRIYSNLRRLGEVIVAAEQARPTIAALRTRASSDGLDIVAARERELKSPQNPLWIRVTLSNPADPTAIYAPDGDGGHVEGL